VKSPMSSLEPAAPSSSFSMSVSQKDLDLWSSKQLWERDEGKESVAVGEKMGGGSESDCKASDDSQSDASEAVAPGKLYRVLTHFDQWISRTFNQISMAKLKSRYKHENLRKFCVSRAIAGLYFERLSLTLVLPLGHFDPNQYYTLPPP